MKKIKPTIETVKIATLDGRVESAKQSLENGLTNISKMMQDYFKLKKVPKLTRQQAIIKRQQAREYDSFSGAGDEIRVRPLEEYEEDL